ncbi:MAG: hypothetical protein J7576_03785 [Siphonobacter aquaeclarae]|jgi:ABC-type uncharacterized transport system YnjBCD substrate-binding protein|nr:hypothetical protein [Siphonobacter aquaeclarae]
MKTLIASALIALSVASSYAAVPEDPSRAAGSTYAVNAFNGKEGKINFLVEKMKGKKLTVRLRDAKGQALFTEDIAKNAAGYARRFDVNSLEEGTYTLEVTDGETMVKKAVEIHREAPARIVSVN